MDEMEFKNTVESLLLNDLYKASKSIHKKYQFMQELLQKIKLG